MDIEYLGDLPIAGYGEWTSKSLEDWVHPEHGPLPDSLSLVGCKGEDFRVAMWGSPETDCVIAVVEMLDRSRTKEEQDNADTMRGQVLFTIRWTVDEDTIECWNRKFRRPADAGRGEAEWTQRTIQALAIESVRVAATTPISPNNEIFNSGLVFKASDQPIGRP